MARHGAKIEIELEQIRLSIESNARLLNEARDQLTDLERSWQSHADDIRYSIESNARLLAQTRTRLRASRAWWESHAAKWLNRAKEEAANSLAEEKSAIETNAIETRHSFIHAITKIVEKKAPCSLSFPMGEETWLNLPNPSPGEWIRVGSLTVGSTALPITLPISAGVWSVAGGWYTEPDQEQLRTLVRNTILRLVISFDVPLVRTMVFDPELTLGLGVFAELRSIDPLSVPPPLTSDEDLERELVSLVRTLTTVNDRLTAAGFDSYWDALASGHPLARAIPIQLLVVATPPEQMSRRGTRRLEQVRNLAANHGLLIIEVLPEEYDLSVILGSSSASSSEIPGISWTLDEALPDKTLRSICAALVARPRESLAPVVDFAGIVESITDTWTATAADGLEVQIGVTTDKRPLFVRLRSEDPPLAHTLVGGSSGYGKTNLLLVIIHALAVRYSPVDLQLVVVDLKDEASVAFERLRPSSPDGTSLPHLRALGMQFDPDYSVAMLKWVTEQMTQRSRELVASSSDKLGEYHVKTGKPIPRLVVVIDEFHRLFEGTADQITKATMYLEHIARTGRSVGVHLILSSNAISGIPGLATKQEAIFNQFHNRISLVNSSVESRIVLSQHNDAATQLRYRGQVVVNDQRGEPGPAANTFGDVAAAEESFLSELRTELHQRGHHAPPSVFRSSEFAHWIPANGRKPVTGLAPVVGLPIGIETSPLRAELRESPNQGLAVVGPDRTIAISVLTRAVVTAVAPLGKAATVTVLDGDSRDGGVKPWITALISHLEQNGNVVERVCRTAIPSRLNQLATSSNGSNLIVAIALDSVDLNTPVGSAVPGNSLRMLLQNGPSSQCWTIGWWQSKSILTAPPNFNAPGIRAWAFCGASLQDLQDVCGHGVLQPTARPRFVWFDRNDPAGAQRLVPFGVADILGEVSLD